MTSLLDNIDGSTTARDTEEVQKTEQNGGILGFINKTRKEHPILFYTFIVAIVVVIVIAIVLIIKRCKGEDSGEKPASDKPDQKESFYATNSFSDEYDYINKYLEASMGADTDVYKNVAITEIK